jgi:hypothetical protein
MADLILKGTMDLIDVRMLDSGSEVRLIEETTML